MPPLARRLSPSSFSSCLCLSFCQKSRRFKAKREGTDCGSRPIKLAGKVIIQEISCLLPVHKALGENYMSVQLVPHCSSWMRQLVITAFALSRQSERQQHSGDVPEKRSGGTRSRTQRRGKGQEFICLCCSFFFFSFFYCILEIPHLCVCRCGPWLQPPPVKN